MDRLGGVFDIVLGVEDLEDAAGAGGGLGHQRDDKSELAQGQEQEGQVEAELLPLAEGEGAADDLSPAEVEDGGLAQVGDQEHERKQEREQSADVDPLLQLGVVARLEADLFGRFGGVRLDHPQAGQVLLQHGVDLRQALLHFAEERLGDGPKAMNTTSATGSTGSTTRVSRVLVRNRITSVPTSRIRACSAISSPWPMKPRRRSTSSVARIISWPVRLRSW